MTKGLAELRALLLVAAPRGDRARAAADWIQQAGSYRWVGIYDVTADAITAIAWTGKTAPTYPSFPRTEGLSGAAVASGRPVIAPDVTKDPRYLTAFGNTRSEAVFPVRVAAGGPVVGTLDVESDRVDAFAKSDTEFLAGCATALAALWTELSSDDVL